MATTWPRLLMKKRKEVKQMPNFLKGMFGQRPKNINIKRDCYTMATVDGDSAEIIMYGEIVEQQPVDWWSGEPIEGQYIIESEFLKDLKAIEDKLKMKK